MKFDVVIVGGGASGVIAALKIKKLSKKSVCILEQNDKIMKKILKTGNGKCNIYNHNIESKFYNDFSLFTEEVDLANEFEELGLLVKEDDMGRMYPYSESANNVVNVLLNALKDNNVEIRTNTLVKKIVKKNNFIINDEIEADNVIIATGSIAQERTNGYELLKSLGHNITDLKPGLVSLVTKEKTNHLKGIRVKCKENNYNISGEVLFKENGLSGIISFDLSRYVGKNDILSFDLAPDYSEEYLIKYLKDNYEMRLLGLFPKMLASDILNRAGKDIKKIVEMIKNYTFTVINRNGFDTAQITIGGVKVDELNTDFSSKKVKGLYVTGEVIDVDGACGGYNLYFAWMSGILAAKSIV